MNHRRSITSTRPKSGFITSTTSIITKEKSQSSAFDIYLSAPDSAHSTREKNAEGHHASKGSKRFSITYLNAPDMLRKLNSGDISGQSKSSLSIAVSSRGSSRRSSAASSAYTFQPKTSTERRPSSPARADSFLQVPQSARRKSHSSIAQLHPTEEAPPKPLHEEVKYLLNRKPNLPKVFLEKYEKIKKAEESARELRKSNDLLATTESLSHLAIKEEDIVCVHTPFKELSTHQKRAPLLWRKMIWFVRIGLWWYTDYQTRINALPPIRLAPTDQSTGMMLLLKQHQVKPDEAFSAKLKSYLCKGERTDADCEALEKMISMRSRAFNRFTLDQRLKFCKILQYEQFPTGRTVIKEGHVSWAFYFLLSGQCEVYKIKENLKYRLNLMNAGDSFGDRTMNLLNDKRTAYIGTMALTELLKVDKSDYFKITNVNDSSHIANRIALLNRIPVFASASNGFIERAVQFFDIANYMPNDTIVHEGTDSGKLYWIVSGECRTLKLVPFIRRTLPGNSMRDKKFTLLPYEYEEAKAGVQAESEHDDEVVCELLHVCDLHDGQHFLDIPVEKHMIHLQDPVHFPKKKLVEFLQGVEEDLKRHEMAPMTVVATTKTQIMSCTRLDFVRLASNEMLIELVTSRKLFHVDVKDLQNQFLEKREWQRFKKTYLEQVRNHKSAHK